MGNLTLRAYEYVLRKLNGRTLNIDRIMTIACTVSASQYAMKHMTSARRLNNFQIIDFCVESTSNSGLFLEFGVFSGRSINQIASQHSGKVFGFDSFEGLPEKWRDGFEKGAFALENLPTVASNVELIVGWFNETLPTFLEQHPEEISFLHIDCDLYSSTKTVLSNLQPRLTAGTIILFDEYFNYPGWEMHEFKAFKEFVETAGIEYEYIALNPDHEQVAVRLTNIPSTKVV